MDAHVLEFTIARLDLQPGDVLVVKVERPISMLQRDRIGELFSRVGLPNKILVLEAGVDLAVLSSTGGEEAIFKTIDDEMRAMRAPAVSA
jgi:hypothetical protein